MVTTTSKEYVLGISALYHDSAAALVVDGVAVAAAHEERFTRIKHDPSFPVHAIGFCLEQAKLSAQHVTHVVFYDKPLLKWERLIETYVAFAPQGVKSFSMAMQVWIREKLFFRRLITKELKKLGFDIKKVQILFTEHHLAHAASAFYPSPFEEAAVLTIDGVGEWATASLMKGSGSRLEKISELKFPHSLGLLYSAFTYYLGFKVNSGEYKLMGLAPYGDPKSPETSRFIDLIRKEMITIYEDGSIFLNLEYFNFPVGLTMTEDAKWHKLLGLPRKIGGDYTQTECNLALAIQNITEEIVVKMARNAQKVTGMKNLCLAGGVALNCVANSKISDEKIFSDIWIQPASGDAGGALGAALAVWHMHLAHPRTVKSDTIANVAYLGPEYGEYETRHMMKKYGAQGITFSNTSEMTAQVAELIAQGKVVGWFQGRMEWGPRALGNRSILADARSNETQKRLNLKIKFREGFRPFAPIVLEEKAKEYFDIDHSSPYMLFVAPVSEKRRRPFPANYHQMTLREKLYYQRSDLPAITHLDYSARLQTVNSKGNPVLAELLGAFEKVTGYPVLVNTSFNVRGEPIVCTPEDAYLCFMRTDMDVLVIGNSVFVKDNQPKLSAELQNITYAAD